MTKVFLGGTVGTSTWRDEMIPHLKVDYFNPVVDDWNDESQQTEMFEKENACNIHLYVITKEMIGVFSIAEAVDSAHNKRVQTIFHVIPEGFGKHQIKSLQATIDLIKLRGGHAVMDSDLSKTIKMKLKAKIKLVDDNIKFIPTKSHETDSCYDLRIRDIEYISPYKVKVKLGLAIQPQEGHGLKIYPRSGLSKSSWMLANSVGVGDEGYTGEYMAIFNYVKATDHPGRKGVVMSFPYNVGDRIVQFELTERHDIDFEIVDNLDDSERGDGGYHSTGK